ncbi:hypothetical protein FRX31_016779 [Thalictrum thalictroides]|uniref:Uncharacterized protein n=1 Tax=Thalictrum thalictroides TaxID=46969 RepID=A0A7J6W9M7_THATH|nr:hypothetical protein FRX31_016779 [Thalictrum thalictroides]
MKLAFSSNGFKALSSSRICGVMFYSTETQTSKPKKVKKDTLYSRIFKVGYDQNVSVVPILVQWAKDGKDFKKEELITIARNLKESRRLKHAYQISQWKVEDMEIVALTFS